MQLPENVIEYINSTIPEKIHDDIKRELKDELESHICDKADFYIEIGYDEKIAYEKAINDMGKPQPICEKFEKLYTDNILKAGAIFISLCIINFILVVIDYGYFAFVEANYPENISIIEMFFFLLASNTFIIYTAKCAREKRYLQLQAIAYAMGLITFGSFFMSGLYYPVFKAGTPILSFLFDLDPSDWELQSKLTLIFAILNFLFLMSYAIICQVKIFYTPKKKKRRLSLRSLALILTVVSAFLLVTYAFAFEKYIYLYPYNSQSDYYYEPYISWEKEQKEIYDSINHSTLIEDADKMLLKNGFAICNDEYENFLSDKYFLFYCRYDLAERFEEVLGEDYYVIYTHDYEETYYDEYENTKYSDVVSTNVIVLVFDNNCKIKGKIFLPDVNNSLGGYYHNTHGEEVGQWFENLKVGENCEESLQFIREIGAGIIESEKYIGNKTQTTYDITFSCFFEYPATKIDLLLYDSPATKDYTYQFEIQAENGVITNLEKVYEDIYYDDNDEWY